MGGDPEGGYNQHDNAIPDVAHMPLNLRKPLALLDCERLQVSNGLAGYACVSAGLIVHIAPACR
jgi:hypothetical protein